MALSKVIKVSKNLYDKLTKVKKECNYSTYSEVIQVMYYAYITSKPLLKEKFEEREKDNKDFKEDV